ncbi:MAG: S8 family serine peptidase [Bdellovibrionales bacterium]
MRTVAETRKKKQVVIAVIDTGADTHHKELRPYLWENLGEMGYDMNGQPKQSNGVDDDNNGYIDDVHGWIL